MATLEPNYIRLIIDTHEHTHRILTDFAEELARHQNGLGPGAMFAMAMRLKIAAAMHGAIYDELREMISRLPHD